MLQLLKKITNTITGKHYTEFPADLLRDIFLTFVTRMTSICGINLILSISFNCSKTRNVTQYTIHLCLDGQDKALSFNLFHRHYFVHNSVHISFIKCFKQLERCMLNKGFPRCVECLMPRDELFGFYCKSFTCLLAEGTWQPPQWRCVAGKREQPHLCTCLHSAGGLNSPYLSSQSARFPELNMQGNKNKHFYFCYFSFLYHHRELLN